MALVRATALKDFRATALSTTDVSTGFQLGAVTTGQQVYGVLHLSSAYVSTDRVFAGAIQSATASGFGSPSTRIAFTLSTVSAAQWGTPAGNFSTDHTWWRASYVLSTAASTNGTWKGLIAMGIR